MPRPRRVSCGHQQKGICVECRRAQYRDYAQRERDRDLARRNATTRVCQHRHGPGVCGTLLEHRTDALGRVVTTCWKCERRRAGVCRDCPRPVEGRIGSAVRCAGCKARARDEQVRAYAVRSHDVVLQNARRRYHADPDKRAKDNEYKRLWRKANPEKVRAQKRRAALRQPKRVRQYMARYRGKHREHYREIARRRYYELNPIRPDPKCTKCGAAIAWEPPGRPYLTCDACCWPYQLRAREAKRAALQAAAAAESIDVSPAKPVRVRRPRGRKLNEHGQRLCLGVACTTVVTGRTKKCEPCRRRETEIARTALAEVAA